MPLEPADIRVQLPHVLRVDKDEGLLWVQTHSNDVLDVLVSKRRELLKVAALLVEILLIVGHLDHEGNVERLLQVLAEDERQHVSKMKSLGGRSATGIKEKWCCVFITKYNVIYLWF